MDTVFLPAQFSPSADTGLETLAWISNCSLFKAGSNSTGVAAPNKAAGLIFSHRSLRESPWPSSSSSTTTTSFCSDATAVMHSKLMPTFRPNTSANLWMGLPDHQPGLCLFVHRFSQVIPTTDWLLVLLLQTNNESSSVEEKTARLPCSRRRWTHRRHQQQRRELIILFCCAAGIRRSALRSPLWHRYLPCRNRHRHCLIEFAVMWFCLNKKKKKFKTIKA